MMDFITKNFLLKLLITPGITGTYGGWSEAEAAVCVRLMPLLFNKPPIYKVDYKNKHA